MKTTLWKLAAFLCLAVPGFSQVQLGPDVQVGGAGTGSGATLPTNAITYGTSSTTSRAATAADLTSLIQAQSGCLTSGNAWNPATSNCIPATGGGGISGQTINSLPLATSSTGSTTSSHFTEAGGLSAVANPFQVFTGTCNTLPGPTFLDHACARINTWDDGTNGTLASFYVNHNAYGGNSGNNGTESRGSVLLGGGFNTAFVTSGIKELWQSNTSCFGIGDCNVLRIDVNAHAGCAYASDECTKAFIRVGQPSGFWAAPITGGTSAQPLFTATTSCSQAFANQSCAPISGGWMMNGIVLKAGKLTGYPVSGTGCSTWMSSIATDQTTIPVSTAYGCSIAANIMPGGAGGTPWNSPQSVTFTINSGGVGSFSAGDHACVFGTQFTEHNTITAVSGSAGTQTITMPLVQPETSLRIFKGDCPLMAFDADDAAGIHYALPAVSIDGIHILYSVEVESQNLPATIPADGVTWTVPDGGANSGFQLHPGARIAKVDTVLPSSNAAWDASNIRVFLMPNSSFSVGDTAYSIDYETQNITGLEIAAIQTQAGTAYGSVHGLNVNINGQGANGSAYIAKLQNAAPTTYYKPYGGPLTEPQFIQGVCDACDNIITNTKAPLTTAFDWRTAQPGQTSYQFLRDPWLNLASDNTGTLTLTGNFHDVNGSITSQFSMIAGVGINILDSGVNNVGLGFKLANTSLGTTWLAPCSQWNLSPTGDLCVGANGSSRTGNDLPPDRGLQAGSLKSFGTAAGTNLFGGATTTSSNATSVLSGPNLQTVSIQGSNTANCRAAFTFEDNFGGTPHSEFEFGAGTSTGSCTHDFYVYDYNTGQFVMSAAAGTDDMTFAGKVNATGGFKYNGAAPSGHCLVGNGTAYVDSASCGGGGSVSGSGTVGTLPLWTGSTTNLGNSHFTDNGSITASTLPFLDSLYQGPSTAPTGACSTIGWAFSQDGNITYCDGSNWISKAGTSPSPTTCITTPSTGTANVGVPVSGSCASNPYDGAALASQFQSYVPATGGFSTDGFGLHTLVPATSGNNYNPYFVGFYGNYWNGTTSATDTWEIQQTLGTGSNPTSQLQFVASGSTGLHTVQLPMTAPVTVYAAAGTALPTCAAGLKGYQAIVSDATSPTYMGTYTSGGAITTAVLCSSDGSSYAWKTH